MSEYRLRDGRRVLPNSNRSYEVKELRARHFEIIRRALLGQSYKDIATDLGVTSKNVSDVLNSELAQEQMLMLQSMRNDQASDVRQQIEEIAPTALNVLRAVIERTEAICRDDPTFIPPPHATKVAKDNLDRAGFGAIHKVEKRHAHMHFTLDEVNKMKERALARARTGIETARETGLVAEYETVEEEEKD